MPLNLKHAQSASSMRPDLGRRTSLPDNGSPRSPAWIAVMVVVLTGIMVAGAVAIWRTGAWTPVSAAAAGHRGPDVKAVMAALESSRVYGRQGEWGKAEAVLRQASEQYPMDQDVRVALAETLVAQRKSAGAYEQYENALAIGPRDPKLEFAAGVTASTAGFTARAAEHFAMAQTTDPTNPSYPLNLAMVQRKLGQLEPAKASLLRAANLDPNNAYAWGTLADIAMGENNLGLALQHVSRARSLQPESREWRVIEARGLKRKGEPETALMVLLPLDVSQKREASVARLMAECYAMLGRQGEAAAVMGDAAEANGKDAVLSYEAAVAFERAGETGRAKEFALRAARLGHQHAGKMAERLR